MSTDKQEFPKVDETWREHSFAKDLNAVKRAERALTSKGWEVMAVKSTIGWKIYIREGGEKSERI